MKKMYRIILTLVMVFLLCGCGEKSVTKTCTMNEENIEETFVLTATDGENVDKVDLIMAFDSEMFGVESFDVLDNNQKEQIKTSVFDSLGLDSYTYDGLNININIQEKLTVTINADINKADAEVLKKIGMDFTGADMNIETAEKELADVGATCK
ncbi:MAG: hypothetical protein IJA94_03410 [Bacilli bacterium]|nr:hypothetical protein [Bacilli bacterium]